MVKQFHFIFRKWIFSFWYMTSAFSIRMYRTERIIHAALLFVSSELFLLKKKSFCYSSLFCYHTILEKSSNANHCDIFDRVVLSFCPKTVNNRPSVSLSQFFFTDVTEWIWFCDAQMALMYAAFSPGKGYGTNINPFKYYAQGHNAFSL